MEAVQRLTGMHPHKIKGKWIYPHSADILAAVHLKQIEYYIHPEAPPYRPQHNPGPQRSEGVQGGKEAPRHSTPFVLG